jgi:hypothetical protein
VKTDRLVLTDILCCRSESFGYNTTNELLRVTILAVRACIGQQHIGVTVAQATLLPYHGCP